MFGRRQQTALRRTSAHRRRILAYGLKRTELVVRSMQEPTYTLEVLLHAATQRMLCLLDHGFERWCEMS